MRSTALRDESQRGFTLIELSIVLVIIGILITALIPIYQNYYESYKRKALESTMGTVRTALADFIIDDDMDPDDPGEVRYPCPAPLDAPIGSATFGLEQCALRNAAVGTCSNGVCVRAGTGGKKVLIGAVPTKSMAIPGSNMFDPYGNRITYAVSADLVQPQSMALMTTSGAIQIVDEGGAVTDNAQFALISHGPDGAGSYTAAGVPNGTPCRSTSQGDAENCNNDAKFRIAEGETSADTADFYDDRTEFTLVRDQDDCWWRQVDDSGQDIVNRNPRNTGVGFTTGAPSQKFDVNGNIRSRQDIFADRNIEATGGWVKAATDVMAGQNVIATNDVNAGNNVNARQNVTAGLYVTAGSDITSTGGNVTANKNLTAGIDLWVNRNAYVQGSINAGTTIHAGTHILAEGNILAGGNIQANQGIAAVNDIHAGHDLIADSNVKAQGFYYTGGSDLGAGGN